MDQLALMHESLEDSIKEVARVCGGTKKLAEHLWGANMGVQAANTRFLDCLNPDRPAKLSPAELMTIARLGRERGCDAVMRFLCAEVGYEMPAPLNREQEINEVQKQLADALAYVKSNMAKLERLTGAR
jgi:hypothetical protein